MFHRITGFQGDVSFIGNNAYRNTILIKFEINITTAFRCIKIIVFVVL